MTTSLRDVSSAQMINTLAEMNCFDQECTVYGYVWQNKAGKRVFKLSEDELFIQRAFESQSLGHACMSSVQQWQTRAILKEETQDDLLLYFKLQLAKQLREDFNEVYFDSLAALKQVPEDNQAETLFLEWKAELDGYFDEEEIMLFDSALDLAYSTKHLTALRYQQLKKWAQNVKKQIWGKIQIHNNFERTFYGVACQNDSGQGYRYIYNANEKTLYNQVKELDKKGICHTPVYQKTYWYSRSNDLPKVRQQFEQDLHQIMDETYLNRIMTIQNLPSAIPAVLWKECMQRVQEYCSANAAEAFLYWARRWNVEAGK